MVVDRHPYDPIRPNPGPVIVAVPDAVRTGLGATVAWLRHARPLLGRMLRDPGAALLPGLPVRSPADVAAVRDALVDRAHDGQEPFAPRRHLGRGVYADYHWPPDRVLCPQHEQSYRLNVPRLVLLACLRPATEGGQTLLADSRRVLAHLPAGLVERLRRHGWLMVRTFRDRIGVPWRDAFGVADEVALAAALNRELVAHRWLHDGALRTVRLRPAIIHDPDTGEACWFNHAAFLNEWGLDPLERQVLREAFGADGLTLNSFAGDGTPLAADEVAAIDGVYERLSVPVPLAAGDVLVLNNILVAHGRRSYTGKRDVALAMGDPVAIADCRPTVLPAMATVDTPLVGCRPPRPPAFTPGGSAEVQGEACRD
jgi:Taurine catabolism dioxygenase TauD, TfdA family